MPLLETKGAASAQGFGFTLGGPANYIEDVFQTWLYTGNGSTQTITNGIDLAGKGGLVWIKQRSGTANHALTDTARGTDFQLASNSDVAQSNVATRVTAFNADGFNLGASSAVNGSGSTYVGWTFREQPKFFDVVTYTGTASTRTVAHNLGSEPGCIIIKRTDATESWQVYHRSLNASGGTAQQSRIVLNSTAAQQTASLGFWDGTAPTSTVFTLGGNTEVNASGGTYVAYLFAHNAGGFGLSGNDNVISCGSFTTNGSGNATIDLGYEPQWVMLKNASATGGWYMFDNMRGMPTPADAATLFANLSAAEGQQALIAPTSTGFTVSSLPAGNTFIYIAIRRGPMRTPTTGTSVFVPYAYAGSGAGTYTTGINQDLFFAKSRNSSSYVWNWYDRLRGPNLRLQSNATNAEASATGVTAFNNTSMTFGASDGFSSASPFGGPYIGYALTRAPGLFDEVCYTVSGFAANNVAHNLTVTPELFITKPRGSTGGWTVYGSVVGSTNNYMTLNADTALQTSGVAVWGATATTFSDISTVANGTYVAYLFASAPGVSKVGSYTGTGTTQTINCGFTAGSRFVMIKRADDVGDWYVWDSARGIVAGNDPYLLLNSTAAEVTSTDYVDTAATGFELSSTAPAAINASGGTFIFLAIA